MTRFEFRQATVVVGIFLLVAAHLFPCAAIRAEDAADVNSVEVIGSSIVYNNDVAMARDVAIRDGLRKAVENAVGVILSSESIVENFQLLSDRIYTESRGFVQGYKVLAESRSENCYNIVIQATVSAGTLRDELQALGILMAQKGMPRTMFFLAEQSIGESQPHLSADLGITENKIAEEMAARGFVLVDRSAAANDIELANVPGTARLADQTAVKLGNQHDAEIVVVGKALARYTKNVMGSQMKSYQANISVKAIRTDTGEIIASSTRSGAAVHTDDVSGGTAALKKVASQAAGDLITQITAKWQREVVESQLVLITVNGIKAYSDFVAFRRILSNRICGVKNVYLRGIDAGEARMDVEIKGTAQTLADELMLKNFDGFGINIFNVSQNAIQLKLVPKG